MKRFLPVLLLLVTGCATSHLNLKTPDPELNDRDYYNVPVFVTDSRKLDWRVSILERDITDIPLGSKIACNVMVDAPYTEFTLHVGETMNPLEGKAWVQVEGILLESTGEPAQSGIGSRPESNGDMVLLTDLSKGPIGLHIPYRAVLFCLTPTVSDK